MIIDKNDLRDILKKVRQHYEYGADTLMSRRQCDKDDLHFCIGDDVQLFYYEQPDAYAYEAVSVRALYETLALIDKGKMPLREWVPEAESFYQNVSRRQWIDIGSMLEDRELVRDLHWQMKNTDWQGGHPEIEPIKRDLSTLSQSDTGRVTADHLWNTYVPPHTVPKPDFLTLKLPIMDEKALSFNENQLKRTGFAEAFTPELKAKMAQGLPEIQHPFVKRYEGDEVHALLHLKKSATSEYYFLNRFDLQLRVGRTIECRETDLLSHPAK